LAASSAAILADGSFGLPEGAVGVASAGGDAAGGAGAGAVAAGAGAGAGAAGRSAVAGLAGVGAAAGVEAPHPILSPACSEGGQTAGNPNGLQRSGVRRSFWVSLESG
jgi:hypothetical protein